MKMYQAYYGEESIRNPRRRKWDTELDIQEDIFYNPSRKEKDYTVKTIDIPKAKVVVQYPYAAVKETYIHGDKSYDVWRWNPYKMKWVRMVNRACGFGELKYASAAALEESKETETMLNNNKNPPKPL